LSCTWGFYESICSGDGEGYSGATSNVCSFDVFHVIIIKVHNENLSVDVVSYLSGCPYTMAGGTISCPQFLHQVIVHDEINPSFSGRGLCLKIC